ncbi:MATE family efflux transporter [Poseidonibacter lekithochrous]|uniref:MATE family efflux transporter n=1 Tax=Poseidonibacter lekithochrous TaxID=1904463 RepID=UPI0008FC3454|nr:MATE family efflux transporter [Poseidonibacter lekithochrous]QKJ22504.1 MATE family efflux protein [Poseidonibacter lekithochrous]
MLDTKPYILFFKYVIPSILGLLAISSASIIDGYFVGNYVGAIGLASINISYPITTVLFGLALMFAVGSSVMVGKLMGENNSKDASNVFTKSIISVSLISIVVCLILYLSLGNILDILNVQDELREKTFLYLPILLVFLPFLMSAIVLDYFVRVDENPNLSFAALFLSSLINVGLDYLFIVKYDWGISGAAYATGISQAAIILILLPHFFSKKATLKLVKPTGSWLNIIQAVKNGVSEFVNESSAGITVLIFNYIMLQNFGATGVASYTIIGYFIMISVMVSFAIADALQPIISKNYGALHFQRIKSFLKLGFLTIIIIEALITLTVLIVPEALINIFLESSELETKRITIEFISYAWPAFIFLGLNILITSYLTSIQKPLYSVVIALLRSLILPVIFIITLPNIFGNVGIFMALAISEFLTFIVASYIFINNRPTLIEKRS